ncbi:hypothetical protein OF829_16965 [Sphingomonas sp. LB-2]|uniref:hypothetical protein n=1 Tax=Sphingomonas caeni TaxID=2984949 RepID=UPI00222EBC9E|nr:hypothetical protein [Sphingomonas caeni]MCW3848931.1 hypothetical protein [Sphingomonas caeni]
MTKSLLLAATAAAALTAFPAAAQNHAQHAGHAMPMPTKPTPKPTPTPTPAPRPHAGHARHGAPAHRPSPAPTPSPHAGHAMPDMPMPAPAPSPAPGGGHAGHAGHGGMAGMTAPAPSPAPTPDPHAGHVMPGMSAPTPSPAPAPDPHAGHVMPGTPSPAPSPAPTGGHAGHAGHDDMPGMSMPAPSPAPAPDPHAGHVMPGTPAPSPSPASAGGHAGHAGQDDMPGMPMPDSGMPLPYGEGSGTARLPGADGGMHGLHLSAGDWMVMAHGYAWGVYTDQSGPRGDSMGFVASMGMLTAERDAPGARVRLQSMFSLEPAMGAPGYPNLFATGETAGGRPLVDRQHPHDLFMELSARVDVKLGGGGDTVFVYGGPVAEPALGPSAFMHRGSARYLPLAPISHHWFDSTHITYGVVTAGYSSRRFQIEASAFRGREPDERRWDIETPALDSWSVRASFSPTPNWLLQVSHGRLNQPESSHPGEDEGRTTASIQYADGRFSGLLAFSAKNRIPGPVLTAWTGEANWNVAGGHNLFGRVEIVENDELFPDHNHPLHDRIFRVAKFEGGYAYRIPLTDTVNLALGGSAMTYARPGALAPYYGRPIGFTAFAKLSLGD